MAAAGEEPIAADSRVRALSHCARPGSPDAALMNGAEARYPARSSCRLSVMLRLRTVISL